MRLKIITLACLLTIAIPVQAGPEEPTIPTVPPVPDNPSDIEEWIEFGRFLVDSIGGCVETDDLYNHDNLAAIQSFAVDLVQALGRSDEAILELQHVDTYGVKNGVRFIVNANLGEYSESGMCP